MNCLTNGQTFSDFPNLGAHHERVKNLDGMADFYKNDEFCKHRSNFKPWFCKI